MYALHVSDGTEQDVAYQTVGEDEEEQAHDDEEALVDRDHHGQHEHSERRVLAGDGEEPQDDDHEPERV